MMNSSAQGPPNHGGRGEASIIAAWHEGGGITETGGGCTSKPGLRFPPLSPRFHLAVVKLQAQASGLACQRLVSVGKKRRFLNSSYAGRFSIAAWIACNAQTQASATPSSRGCTSHVEPAAPSCTCGGVGWFWGPAQI